MVTLADVARRANVSKMTVSRVINHPEQVTDELKKLVFAAMHELDYRPNVAAKALAKNRTQIVKFFILEEISTVEPYYTNLLLGISLALSRHQYSLQLVANNNFDLGVCDGYIITGMRSSDYEWISRIEKPVILFGENLHGYDFVDTNNKEGGMLSTRYALSLGYDKVVFVGIDLKEAFEYSRERGYLQVMQESLREPEIVRVENHSHKSQEMLQKNWEKYPKNTAFVCASDRIAVGIERAIQKRAQAFPMITGSLAMMASFWTRLCRQGLQRSDKTLPNWAKSAVRCCSTKSNKRVKNKDSSCLIRCSSKEKRHAEREASKKVSERRKMLSLTI